MADEDIDGLYDKVNAELIKHAQDILALDNNSWADETSALADMVERLTAIWFSGYEWGLEYRLDESLELEYEDELEVEV